MNELLNELSKAKTLQDLDNIKSKWLGKKSALKAEMDSLRELPADARIAKGAEINDLRAGYEAAIETAKRGLRMRAIDEKLASDNFDMSLPGVGLAAGALHPVTILENKIVAAMRRLGFVVEVGPEIETPEYNFDLLDIPDNHPARDMQDTFWIEKDKLVLRTHTTNVQSRFMMSLGGDESKLPVKIISLGRVYRNEAVDAWHLAIFHQFEGLLVGRDVKLSELNGVIKFILREIFGENVKIRIKPKYYPYTTCSIGADVFYDGKWITIVGAGMVSPPVLRNFGFAPDRVSGFAFGFGLSRLAAMFSGTSMRELYKMDVRVFKNIKGI